MKEFEEIAKLSKSERVKKLLLLDSDKRNKVLKNFPPEERISLMKEIKVQLAKEEKEADNLVKESFEQIERNEIAKKIPLPETKPVDINKLFTESKLEENLKEVHPRFPEKETSVEYRVRGENQGNVQYALNLYNELNDIVQTGTDSYMSIVRAADIYDKIKELSKYESQSEATRNIAEGSRRIMKELFGEYLAKQDYVPGK
jgi:hypothetical protein